MTAGWGSGVLVGWGSVALAGCGSGVSVLAPEPLHAATTMATANVAANAVICLWSERGTEAFLASCS